MCKVGWVLNGLNWEMVCLQYRGTGHTICIQAHEKVGSSSYTLCGIHELAVSKGGPQLVKIKYLNVLA